MEDNIYKSIAEAYNKGAIQYAKKWDQPHIWLEEEREFLVNKFKNKSTLLEIGSGPGNDSYFWDQMGLTTLGIDISHEMIEIARKKYPRIQFEECNFIDFNTTARFDIIWCSYSLLHFPPETLPTIAKKIYELLNDEGYLYLPMGVADKTNIRMTPVEGLLDANENPVSVYNVRWNIEELRSHFSGLLMETSFNLTEPFPGVGAYSSLWKKSFLT